MILKLRNILFRNDSISLIKRNAHLFEYSVKSQYQIPSHILNILYTANASLWDNMLYNFHSAIQVAYKDLTEKISERGWLDDNSKKIINSFIKFFEPTKNIYQFTFPFSKENGDFKIIQGYRVQHCNYKMPHLGGIRITENVSVDNLKGLATFLTFQYANIQLPFSGSFGCIEIDPNKFHPRDLQKIVSIYTIECSKYRFMDPATDIFFPDINTTSREMNWMADTFQQTIGHQNLNSHSVVTGKSAHRNGIQNYHLCASYAVYSVLNNLFMDHDKMSVLNLTPNWADKTFVVQGFGKVGQSIALTLTRAGAKCVGIQDVDKTAVFNNDGLDVGAIIEHFEKNKTLAGCVNGTEYHSNITGYFADMVILSSTQKVLNRFNVDKVVARIVVEAAYLAITPAAHKTLVAKNILVLPDILVACGSAIGSYMEYLKNVNRITFGHIGWEEYFVKDKVTSSVQNAVAEITGEMPILSGTIIDENKTVQKSESTEAEIIRKVIETIMTRTNDEVCETLDKYDLGLDLRLASYVNTVKHMFDVFYSDAASIGVI